MDRAIIEKMESLTNATPFAMFGALDGKADLAKAIAQSKSEWTGSRRAPLVSVIIPLYNSEPRLLEEAILSVLMQSYPNWEIVAVDDGSSSREHFQVIEKYCSLLPKKVKFGKALVNGGISAARNQAISASLGELVSFLDHDDILHPLAISELVKSLELGQSSFAHSFEVKLTNDGLHLKEFLSKPKFSWFTLLHLNYVCHFTVMKRELLDSVRLGPGKWFDPEFDGAEDHELFIRCSQSSLFKSVVVPYFLYLWRLTELSTSSNQANKPLSKNRNMLAAMKHVPASRFRGEDGGNQHPFRTHTYLKHLSPNTSFKIAVVGTEGQSNPKNRMSIAKQVKVKIEIFQLPPSKKIGIATWINQTLEKANCDYVLLAHPDLEYNNTDVAREAAAWLEQYPEIGSIGISVIDTARVPSLSTPNVDPASYPIHTAYSIREQPGIGGGYRFVSFLEKRWFSFESRQVLANTKHFMMMRKRDFMGLGGLDAGRFPDRGYDLDICLRLTSKGFIHINLGAVGVEGQVLDECKMGFGDAEQSFFYDRTSASLSVFQLCFNHAYNVNQLQPG